MLTLLSQYSKKPQNLNNSIINNNNPVKKNQKDDFEEIMTEIPQKQHVYQKKPSTIISTQHFSQKIQPIQGSMHELYKKTLAIPVKNNEKHHVTTTANTISTDEKSTSSFTNSSSQEVHHNEMEIEKKNTNDENVTDKKNTLNIRLENLKKARENQKSKKNPTTIHLPEQSSTNKKIDETPKENNQIKKTSSEVVVINPLKRKIAKLEEEDQKHQQEQQQQQQQLPDEKQKYKRKSKMEKYKLWNKDCYFISIDPPVKLPDESKTRYKICFKYFSAVENKVKRKTICFGRKDTEYFIDHNDDERNRIWLSKQRGYYTPFHKNFWINYLLCSELSVNKAYNKTLEMLLP